MKKAAPYIFALLLLGAVALLFLTGSNKRDRQLDERVTLSRKDKIPYGTYAAFINLPHLFPGASIYVGRKEPAYWDSISTYDSNQALISISLNFSPDEFEMTRLIRFAERGNDVFISARHLSYEAEKQLVNSQSSSDIKRYYRNEILYDGSDTLTLSLLNPPYRTGYKEYKYPGKRLAGFFERVNESTMDIIGSEEDGSPYFVHLKAGKGNFYVHLAPLAFSNYFILHDDNIGYYEKALSVINPSTTKIYWDEYFLTKRSYDSLDPPRQKRKGWLAVFMRYPGLKAALLTGLGALILFILLGMRRTQRYIPVFTKPRNDSLDFVKTIGRLYFDRGDHKNLCRKMAAYFLEHVRNSYKLPTGTLDQKFVDQLRFKTGIEEKEISGIVSFIRELDNEQPVSNSALVDFHNRLESFYKKA